MVQELFLSHGLSEVTEHKLVPGTCTECDGHRHLTMVKRRALRLQHVALKGALHKGAIAIGAKTFLQAGGAQ